MGSVNPGGGLWHHHVAFEVPERKKECRNLKPETQSRSSTLGGGSSSAPSNRETGSKFPRVPNVLTLLVKWVFLSLMCTIPSAVYLFHLRARTAGWNLGDSDTRPHSTPLQSLEWFIQLQRMNCGGLGIANGLVPCSSCSNRMKGKFVF